MNGEVGIEVALVLTYSFMGARDFSKRDFVKPGP